MCAAAAGKVSSLARATVEGEVPSVAVPPADGGVHNIAVSRKDPTVNSEYPTAIKQRRSTKPNKKPNKKLVHHDVEHNIMRLRYIYQMSTDHIYFCNKLLLHCKVPQISTDQI